MNVHTHSDGLCFRSDFEIKGRDAQIQQLHQAQHERYTDKYSTMYIFMLLFKLLINIDDR